MSTATLTAPASSLTLPSSDRVLFSTPAVIEDYRIDERCQPYAKPGADGLTSVPAPPPAPLVLPAYKHTNIEEQRWTHSQQVLKSTLSSLNATLHTSDTKTATFGFAATADKSALSTTASSFTVHRT